ncbi:hypothetical protein ZIOFF_001727 [Zingiber officinale]|uniref:Lactate/malate dehydrogenase C-terminal domain-containing protein n=1 Tax=Zingiber officinale TaxID=94328 RepID=A0A8J5HZ11_ZINOF|nr:hypothetical protein ZIOFF_001727 [Zingiber officinale]
MLLAPPPPPLPPPPPPLAAGRFLYPRLRPHLHFSSHASISHAASASTSVAASYESILASLDSRRYDFSPLLEFLSSSSASAPVSGGSAHEESPPISLDPLELRLAETYRAVPAFQWHALLKNLAVSTDTLPSAAALVTWLERHRLCFSSDLLYSILIHALGRHRCLDLALQFSSSAVPSPLTLNALISASALNGRPGQALQLLSLLRQHGFLSDHPNYTLILQSLLRSPDPPDPTLIENLLFDLLSTSLEPDARLLSDFVTAFAHAGDPDRSLSLLAATQSQGLTPKSSAIVALLSALGANGRVPEAEAVFLEFYSSGLKPSTRAYNALLKGYVKIGALKDAELIFQDMEHCGVSPNEATYSLLIDAYMSAGRWESAKILIKEMEENDVQPNSYVFSRILASLRDKGDWQKSFAILKEMRSNGIHPDRHFYNVMIDTFGKYNCLHHAMDAFDKMRLDGIKPDEITWNTLIDAHCKAGRHDKAIFLFEKMQESGSGCSPCTTTYNIMLNSLGEQGRWEELKEMFEVMKKQGLLPNVVTYTTLVDAYGKSGRFKEAIECLEAMKAGGMKPSPTMYNALVNAYAQRGLSEQAMNAFKVMRADGIRPSVLVLNSLINAFGEDRRVNEAFAVLEFMKESDLKPDVVTYTTLMKTLIRVEKFDMPDIFIRGSFDEEEDEVNDDERVTRRTVIRERPWYLKEDKFWHLIDEGLEFEDEPLKYNSKVYKEEHAEVMNDDWLRTNLFQSTCTMLGQIGYAIVPMIARGVMLGSDQFFILHMLDIPPAEALNGIKMELVDAIFPLLKGVVLVDANPANTNALILKEFAPSIPAKNIICLTRLDHNRALGQISERLNVQVSDIKNAIIWGNHSPTQYLDVPSVYEEMISSGCIPDRKARAMLRSALRYMKQIYMQ